MKFPIGAKVKFRTSRAPSLRIPYEVSMTREFNGVDYALLVWTAHNRPDGRPHAEWMRTDILEEFYEEAL